MAEELAFEEALAPRRSYQTSDPAGRRPVQQRDQLCPSPFPVARTASMGPNRAPTRAPPPFKSPTSTWSARRATTPRSASRPRRRRRRSARSARGRRREAASHASLPDVPFRLPRSSMPPNSPRSPTRACWRDTLSSPMATWHVSSRPTTTGPRTSKCVGAVSDHGWSRTRPRIGGGRPGDAPPPSIAAVVGALDCMQRPRAREAYHEVRRRLRRFSGRPGSLPVPPTQGTLSSP